LEQRLHEAHKNIYQRLITAKNLLSHIESAAHQVRADDDALSAKHVQDARNHLKTRQVQATADVQRGFSERSKALADKLGTLLELMSPATANSWVEGLASPEVSDTAAFTGFLSLGEACMASATGFSDRVNSILTHVESREGQASAFTDNFYPALVPFDSVRGLYLTGDERDARLAALEAVCNLVALIPDARMRIHVFDPCNTALFGRLSPLRQLRAELFPLPLNQSGQLSKVLESILASSTFIAERIVNSGADSLMGMWAQDPLADGLLDLLVLLDYPFGIDTQAQELLLRVSRLGCASGIQLIIQEQAHPQAARDVDAAALKDLHRCVRYQNGRLHIEGYPDSLTVRPSQAFSETVVENVVSARIESAKHAKLPTVALESIISEDIGQPWTRSASEALRLRIGVRGKNEPMDFEIRSESPPNTNLLIGGAVGQGKSNLLMDIIYSAACAYSPDELELLLLDFKQGIEFKRFDADGEGRNWLPHVKVLCLESNQSFGLAVLRYVDGELERRAAEFKKVALPNGQKGVSSLQAYREATGLKMPRMLVVIDEFHRLFEGERDGVDEAVALVENLAKQGRASGIHLILASQTISGISAMGMRKDGIFAQFPLRLSLKNNPAESQAILSPGNKAAAELSYRGEVVLNQNTGIDPENANERGLAAYVDPEVFAQVQSRLWETGHDRPPLLFRGASFAEFPKKQLLKHNSKVADDEHLRFWLGQRIEIGFAAAVPDSTAPGVGVDGDKAASPSSPTELIHSIRISRDADQGVAIIGPDDEREPVMPALLATMLESSLAWRKQNGIELLILHGEGEEPSAWLSRLLELERETGIAIHFIGRSQVRDYLIGPLRSRLDPSGTKDSQGQAEQSEQIGNERLSAPPGTGPQVGQMAAHTAEPQAEVAVTNAAGKSTGASAAAPLLILALGLQRIANMDEEFKEGDGFAAPRYSGRSVLQDLASRGAVDSLYFVGWWNNLQAVQNDMERRRSAISSYITVKAGLEDLKSLVGVSAKRIDGHPRIGFYDRNGSDGLIEVIPFTTERCL
jgi:hypothetical protein